MLRQRTIQTLIYLPLILGAIFFGGWLFTLGVMVVLALAADEYGTIYSRSPRRPARLLLIVAVVGFVLARRLGGFEPTPWLLAAFLMLAMVWHLVDYERGAETPGTDFALTVAGGLYLGWMGSYLISLRELPGGFWWLVLVLPTVWLADVGAYLVGSAIGRHQMSPRLSPKKTWEGFGAGMVFGTLGGWGLAAAYSPAAGAPAAMQPALGLVLGLSLSLLTPLGDLGISMMKRELGVKDTGARLPGHGGFLDRMDSWLWAVAISFHLIQWLPTLR
jgi:phosphatidate cytidylyltransferase